MVMETPPSLAAIIAEANKRYDEPDDAVNYACEKWRKHPERAKYLDQMERAAIRGLIGDNRHHKTTALKNAAGLYGGPSKLSSEAIEAASVSIFDSYSIGGTRLGNILGKEIEPLAAACEARATGEMYNTALLRAIAPAVGEDQAIRDCTTVTQVFGLLQAIQQGKPFSPLSPRHAMRR